MFNYASEIASNMEETAESLAIANSRLYHLPHEKNDNGGRAREGTRQTYGVPRAEISFILDNLRTIRYDTRCYFNVRSKVNMSQLIPHGTDN